LPHKENEHDVKERPKVITFLGIERKEACRSSQINSSTSPYNKQTGRLFDNHSNNVLKSRKEKVKGGRATERRVWTTYTI
jgi:hypothetical protein